MSQERDDPHAELIRTLAKEAGVSEADIRAIIAIVGPDRSSILREARILKRTRS